MESVGQALGRWRKLRGLSLRELADGIHHSHVYLWEIEKGRKRPLPEIISSCDDVLETGGELTALLHRDEVDVNRREFVKHGLTLATVPLFSPAETMTDLNDQLWRVFAAAPNKSAILPLIQAQLNLVTDQGMRGNLLQLAGEIHFDASRHADAVGCYLQAATASKAAGDNDLWACSLARQAFVRIFERRYDEALSILERAEKIAGHGDSQATTAPWIQAVKAQALAGLGRLEDCRQALDRASDTGGKVHNGGWLRFDGSRLPEEAGACFVSLKKPDLAETALLAALSQPTSLRRHGIVIVDLAMVGILRKDREYATHYAAQALDVARQTGSGVVAHKLANLQSHMLEAL